MKISANIVDVLARSIYPGTVVIEDGVIVDVIKDNGRYERFILPPFIDAHVHVESSMLVPTEFARLAVVHGTGAAVSDPHEIANVLGMQGVAFMLENAEKTPFRFYFGAPSCVPATPFETAGGTIDIEDIRALFEDDRIKYLSEMMNIPGVLSDDSEVLAKIAVAQGKQRPIDGHAPLLRGTALQKYVASGITADHETISYQEGKEKIALGMKVQIRQGSAAKNFRELAPLLREHPEMCMLCSDDLHPDNLVTGHINLLVKEAVSFGIDLMDVLQAACVTPVDHYRLDGGLLRVGDSADYIVVDNLVDFTVQTTCIKGQICAENGSTRLPNIAQTHVNRFVATAKLPADFAVPASAMIDVITITDGQLVTGRERLPARIADGKAITDLDRDILKLTVINRYGDAPPAVAFVRHFGITAGALAGSVAHDSHNVIAVGCDDESIARAVNAVIANRGGLAAVAGDETVVLGLPVAGLMTDADGYQTAALYERIDRMAKRMGSPLHSPFMTLSFLALLVIPALKLSDKGLFDGETFSFVDVQPVS